MGNHQSQSDDFDINVNCNNISLEYNNGDSVKKLTLEECLIHLGYLKKKNLNERYLRALHESVKTKAIFDQLEATTKELRKQNEYERKNLENMNHHSIKTTLQQTGNWNKRKQQMESNYKILLTNYTKSEKELKYYHMKNYNSSKILEIIHDQILRKKLLYEESNEKLKENNEIVIKNSKKLIDDMKKILETQEVINLTLNKWVNGKTMLIYSQSQIAFGINKWKNMLNIPSNEEKNRYFIGAEAKNNFIAAFQNIESCKMYIGNKITFPYAQKEKVVKIEEILNDFFNDVSNDEKGNDCLKFLNIFHVDVSDLIKWVHKVITESMLNDFENGNKKLSDIEEKIDEERLPLISEKFKNIDNKIMKYENEDWEKTIEELKEGKYIHSDILDIMTLSKPNLDRRSIDKLAPMPDRSELNYNVQEKINQFENQKLIFDKRKESELNKQNIKLDSELVRRRKIKKPYNFD
uniref:NYD-SP28_assoc domain-containing protein n=1 Tax=Parastrongyloides trichosuri TaxID=131310 RepID=A0A0N4ZUR8_PARTI